MAKSGKKTTEKIRSGLIDLLESAGAAENVSVTELCEHANINRATFYYHYQSVADVFEEIEDNVRADFEHAISAPAMTDEKTPDANFFAMFFSFVARNASVCKLIVNAPHTGKSTFLTNALEIGRKKVSAMMKEMFPDCPADSIDYYYTFVSSGFLGLITYWLNSDMREPIELIADIGARVAYSGIDYLKAAKQ